MSILRISEYRKRNDLTQAELSELLGVSTSCVAQWENGTRTPNIRKLQELAKLFGCTVDDLIVENDGIK